METFPLAAGRRASACSAAAEELFYQEGVQSVGIDKVVERAGVAKASLYSNFKGKDDLVRAYLTRAKRRAAPPSKPSSRCTRRRAPGCLPCSTP
jgi:AcrR family transcriptional regulator